MIFVHDIWKPDNNGNIWVNGRQLMTLRGSPTIVYGDFSCRDNELESLEYGPAIVHGDYQCTDNRLTTLHNIHHHVKEVHGLFCFGSQPKVKLGVKYSDKLTSHLLGLCFIEGLTGIRCCGAINDIFDKYRHDVLLFQDALIDAGFVEQAKF